MTASTVPYITANPEMSIGGSNPPQHKGTIHLLLCSPPHTFALYIMTLGFTFVVKNTACFISLFAHGVL